MSEEYTEEDFFFLNNETFEVRSVKASRTTNEYLYLVAGEGNCIVNVHLFKDTISLRKHATEILHQKEVQLVKLTEAYRKL